MIPVVPDLARLQALYAAAEGIIDLHVVRKKDRVGLICVALDDDAAAVRLIEAVRAEDERVSHSPKDAPALCVACDRLARSYSCSVVVATPKGATDPITMSVCRSCAKTRFEAFAAAERVMRHLFPDAVLRRADLPRGIAK